MKSKLLYAFGSLFLVLFVFIRITECKPGNLNDVNTNPAVVAPAFWFSGPTTPAPSDTTPFNNPSNTSDSSFHLWAWQKFLSITRSAGTKASFESYVQVDNFFNAVSDTIFLSDSSQAGTHGVLYDKQNHAILYTIHVNQQMYNFSRQYLPVFRGVLAAYASWPHANKQDSLGHDLAVQHALDSLHLDTLNYPVGCVELKTSWIYAADLGADSVNYYLTNAIVETSTPLYTKNSVLYVTHRSVKRMAMLGMHVIGRVANHPELIWSTFEHEGLAPQYPWGTQWPQDTINAVPSTNSYLFYNGGNTVAQCPMNNGPTSPPGFTGLYNMFELGITKSFISDSLPSHRDSTDNANVVSLNASVKAQLTNVNGPWKNYFYKGALWLKYPNSVFGPGRGYLGSLGNGYLRGARALSDITMESFGQVDFSGIFKSGSMNCFGCHGTVDYVNVWYTQGTGDSLKYNLALSHLFKNALGKPQPDVTVGGCRNCNVELHKR